jgi:fermentation-respiration switch protein FrsA (DUF1100 family)
MLQATSTAANAASLESDAATLHHSRMRFALLGLAILAVIYLLLIAAAWAWQERIVWQPPRQGAYPEPHAVRIAYAADDGQPLFAYLVGDPARSNGLLIAFHGNAELAAWNVAWAHEVERRTGRAVLLPEYRGYGGLGGVPTYDGSRSDALAAYRVARERLGVDASGIALYGHSLGTAVAAELASEHAPDALVLFAPFTSARDMAAAMRVLPMSALWGIIGRVAFDTRARVQTLDSPVWVTHGDRDLVIPVRMGREVYDAARRKGELLIVPGAGHNDLPQVGGERYWGWLTRACARHASDSLSGHERSGPRLR